MSTSELVITELVFDNFFKDLDVECTVAILSCMVSTKTSSECYISVVRAMSTEGIKSSKTTSSHFQNRPKPEPSHSLNR